MKFRTIVFVLIFVIILIAAFTKPGPDEFKEYYLKTQRGVNSPPVIEYANGVAYSIFTITTYTITSDGNKPIALAAPKIKYLGLFGRFWKLD